MGYSDQKYHSRPLVNSVIGGTATFTTTTAGTGTQAAIGFFKPYKRRTKINNIKIFTVTAAAANALVTNFVLLNGTNTVGTLTAAPAAGSASDFVMVANVVSTVTQTTTLPNGSTQVGTLTLTTTQQIFGTGSAPTLTIISTATASAQVGGTYNIFFEEIEQPDV